MTAVITDHHLASLSAASGLNLAMFRPSHVEARVARAIALEKVAGIDELHDRLMADDASRAAFRKSLAISVTGMFRDPEQFDALADVLKREPPARRPVRAWSAGCSTGEEAWSIAATLARAGRAEGALVVGSDVLVENVRDARRQRPSIDDLGGRRIPPTLRIRFECRDIVRQGAPGSGWDLVLCRNVAIYLDEDRRHAVHELLAAAVGPSGLLMLGRSERLGEPASLGLQRVVPHIYRRMS